MWTNRSFLQFGFISFFLLASLSAPIDAQTKERPAQTANKPAMTTKRAKGTFEVKVTPVKDDDALIVEGMSFSDLNVVDGADPRFEAIWKVVDENVAVDLLCLACHSALKQKVRFL